MNADIVAFLEEDRTGVLLGLEGGLMPSGASGISAVARLGVDAAGGDDALGALRLGAGIGLGDLDLDYAYQDFEAFGAVHRVGLRWTYRTR